MSVAPTIALLGVSGVGKSRLAARIATSRPEILRLSAGRLLRATLHTTGKALRTAASGTVLQNQLSLVAALRDARDGQWDRPVLLEAHAFIDNDRELVDVPVEVMRALEVDALIVLIASQATIARRRHADRDRVRPARTLQELRLQQRHLLRVARLYANCLPARLAVFRAGRESEAIAFVDEVVAARPLTTRRD